jgi:hypothetical protein
VKGSDEDRGEIRVVIHDSFSFLLLLHHCSRYYNRSGGGSHALFIFFFKMFDPDIQEPNHKYGIWYPKVKF